MMVPLLSQPMLLAVMMKNGIKMLNRKTATNVSMHRINQDHRGLVFRASGLRIAEMNAGTRPRAGSTAAVVTP